MLILFPCGHFNLPLGVFSNTVIVVMVAQIILGYGLLSSHIGCNHEGSKSDSLLLGAEEYVYIQGTSKIFEIFSLSRLQNLTYFVH